MGLLGDGHGMLGLPKNLDFPIVIVLTGIGMIYFFNRAENLLAFATLGVGLSIIGSMHRR